jgi:soluble lytic murein transglycosylase
MVGLMQVESGFDPNAQSDKAAYGLMQVRFPTALEIDHNLQSYWQLFDPERNIRLGTAYFRRLLDRYNGDYRIAALAYNRGPSRLDDQILSQIELSDSYYRKIRAAGAIN